MALSFEEQEDIRAQLREQVASLPDAKRAQALEQIATMSEPALASLLEQSQSSDKKKSIFRMIILGEIESKRVEETNQALAILDINPISKGHTLIIPKQAILPKQKIPASLNALAKRIAKRITKKLKAKRVEITTQEAFGEQIMHIIPEYDKKLSLQSPRTKASSEELETILNLIKKQEKKQKLEVIRKTTALKSEASQFVQKRRIP